MKLFGSLCILGLALAEDLGPRGKNKKNKKPQADEIAFAPNVPDYIEFQQSSDFTVLQGNMLGNVTIVAYDDQQPPQLVCIISSTTIFDQKSQFWSQKLVKVEIVL